MGNTGGRPRGFPGGWAALCFLGCFVAGQGMFLLLGPDRQASFLAFASTNVANLTHEPVGCLAASAFVTGGDVLSTLTWLPLIAIALAGAVRAVGTWRTVAVAAAGHVVGTLVSEGALSWRIWTGARPDGFRYLTDVGPSYVVVSALTLAILALPWSRRDRGAWTWRSLTVAAMLVLIFPGQIFSGLFRLDVAAVGHVTAIAVALLAAPLVRRRALSPPRAANLPRSSRSRRRRSFQWLAGRRATCAPDRTS